MYVRRSIRNLDTNKVNYVEPKVTIKEFDIKSYITELASRLNPTSTYMNFIYENIMIQTNLIHGSYSNISNNKST